MARLNEPVAQAAPVESVEALKRRFLRQNREIARANSTQSLRIRTLEAETSRLFSENLVLRGRIISLQHELDDRPKREALENLGLVKDKLESKLAELGDLVFELGRTQNNAVATSASSRRQSRGKSPKRSPNQRNWKNALTVSEVAGGQDGRLPPIVEDKYYPRRTLDSEDLLGILDDQVDSADSPDLGPPPVAHFEDGDPVKQDGDNQASLGVISGDSRSSLAFTNLETRRKRRESSFSRESISGSASNQSTTLEETSTPIGTLPNQPLKLGAKRKLSVRDDEERVDGSTTTDKDDFRFNRRTEALIQHTEDIRSSEGSGGVPAQSTKLPQELAFSRPDLKEKVREVSIKSTTGRKALGEKSVNTDPVLSPRKPSKATLKDKVVDQKRDATRKPHDRERSRVNSSVSRPVYPAQDFEERPKRPPEAQIPFPQTATIMPPTTTIIPPPATPTCPGLDLFSPLSSQPPDSRPDSRDTPPPGDIHPDVSSKSSTSTSMSRTTRRPRGSVSYTEPNLRDKMRRPGKELVDAVGADERIQRAPSVKADDRPVSQSSLNADDDVHILHTDQRVGTARMRTIVIKKEEGIEDQEVFITRERQKRCETRAEAQSPLSSKISAVGDLPASVITDRKRRTSELLHSKYREESDFSAVGTSTTHEAVSSGSGSAIAALVAGTRGKQLHKSKTDAEPAGHRDKAATLAQLAPPDVYDFQGSSDAEAKDPAAHARSSSVSSTVESKPADIGERVRVARRSSSVADINGAIPSSKTSTGSIRGRKRRETVSTAADTGEEVVKATAEGVGKHEAGTRAERAVARRRSMLI